jgi:hypothetical protein
MIFRRVTNGFRSEWGAKVYADLCSVAIADGGADRGAFEPPPMRSASFQHRARRALLDRNALTRTALLRRQVHPRQWTPPAAKVATQTDNQPIMSLQVIVSTAVVGRLLDLSGRTAVPPIGQRGQAQSRWHCAGRSRQ